MLRIKFSKVDAADLSKIMRYYPTMRELGIDL